MSTGTTHSGGRKTVEKAAKMTTEALVQRGLCGYSYPKEKMPLASNFEKLYSISISYNKML